MNILIITPSWIGDSVISHTLYRLLTNNNPKIKIDVITQKWTQALFYRMPEINTILPLTCFKHRSLPLIKYYQFSTLLKKKYQQSIILPNSFKSSLIPLFAGIKKRTGWRGEMRYGTINDLRILNPAHFPSMIHRYAALAFDKQKIKNSKDLPHPLPYPYLYCTSEEVNTISKKFNITNNNNQKNIGICPGAEFSPSKCWPASHYATLVLQLIHQGYHIILLGSHKEKIIGEIIKKNIPNTLKSHYHNLIGLTSLDEAILIIKQCHAIISNDSGLLHIACALQRPVIALYGPSNPHFTPPLYHYAKIMQQNDYKNCTKKIMKRAYYQNKYHKSLINIHPQNVLQELNFLLKYYDKN